MIRVESVEVVEEGSVVFDITVDVDHSFVVGGVVAHNSEICINLDGKRFRYDDPSAPTPPAHWNCRSAIAPIVSYKNLGLREPNTPDRQLYPDWFAQQPNAVQDDILGPGRARLVRNGTVGLADLVRRDGSRVPLSALEE